MFILGYLQVVVLPEVFDMSRRRLHVVPGAEGWEVKEVGGRVLARADTKAEAIGRGREIAQARQPSQLIVHRQDGTFEFEHTYGGDPFPPRG